MIDQKKLRDDLEKINRILAIQSPLGPVGIFARKICEICGREKNFSGFVEAMMLHDEYSRFYCFDCRHRLLGETGSGLGKIDQVIKGRGMRFCNICGIQVKFRLCTEREIHESPFRCCICKGLGIKMNCRFRYLAWHASQGHFLEGFYDSISEMKKEIDEMVYASEESNQRPESRG